jgi:hypothetical protein
MLSNYEAKSPATKHPEMITAANLNGKATAR